MPRRVVPSQVVSFIEQTFATNEYSDDPKTQPAFGHTYGPQMTALLELTNGIPDELLPLPPQASADLLLAKGAIQYTLQRWSNEPRHTLHAPGPRLRTPVSLIYHALKGAPDEATPAETTELRFLNDRPFEDVLRADLAAIERAHANGEWKAATVLAGSVVEALLLWALKRDEGAARAATSAPKSRPDLDEWYLADLLRVAKELKLCSESTLAQIELAKDYRNLIHPGRAIREGAKCNRGTARAASAAVEFVVRELAERFPPQTDPPNTK